MFWLRLVGLEEVGKVLSHLTGGEDLWMTLKVRNHPLNPNAQLVHPAALVKVTLISPPCLYMHSAIAVVEGFIMHLGWTRGEIKNGWRRRLLLGIVLNRLARLSWLSFRLSEGWLLGNLKDRGRWWMASRGSHAGLVEEVGNGWERGWGLHIEKR